MTNGEKYKDEITKVGYDFALSNDGMIIKCGNDCDKCKFYGDKCKYYAEDRAQPDKIKWLLEEYKEPILTDEEKTIIKDIIKASEPFNKKPVYISKIEYFSTVGECFLEIEYEDDRTSTPNFKYDELFKGMELRKEYSLKELGL